LIDCGILRPAGQGKAAHGCDPQRRAPVNATFAQTFSCCAYALKCLIDPDVPTNAGFYACVRVDAPAGTVVNCTSPAPVVGGIEHILREGPLIIACNHYQRRGLWVGWPGSVATLAIAEQRGNDPPIHWLATGGLRVFQWRGDGPAIPLSGVLFRRVAGIYGMNFRSMPELDWRVGYPLAVGLMAVSAGALYVAFKRRGWL